MSKKLYLLISFVLVVTLASASYAADPCVIGNWEDSNDGWLIDPCAPVGTTTDYNATTGVTLDTKSLKLSAPEPNWQRAIYIQLDDANLVDEFFDGDIFSVDVTRLANEWSGPGTYAGVQLVVNANSVSGSVWQDLGPRVWWSPPDGNTTQKAVWDYSTAKALIDEATVSYLELIIVTNYDPNFTTGGIYYLDNAQLRAYAGVIGDWENEMDGWAIWPAAPNGTTTDYNDTIGVTLNSHSLELYVPEGGPQEALYIQLDDEGLVDDFFRSSLFSVDVTRLAEQWTPGDPNAFSGVELIVNARSDSGDVYENLAGRLWWSPGDGNNPRTAIWDYSTTKAGIDPCSISWLEFIIVTNFDDVNYTDGTYYLDNAQLLPKTGFIVIGDWENEGDGWIEWSDPQDPIGPPQYTYVPTGATLNSWAVKVIPDGAWDQNLTIKLQDQSYNLLGEGLANNKFSIDVTFVRDEWVGSGGACGVELTINEEGIGWVGLGLPDTDTNNPDTPGQWDADEYPPGTIYTTTIVWDYSSYVPDMTSTVDPMAGFLEFILVTTYDVAYNADGNSSGSFYFDNARLTDGPMAGASNPANGATDVEKKPTLSWWPGRYADTHDVYFGTDEAAVSDANRANDPCGVLVSEDQNDNTHGPVTTLKFDTTYYWRIDEVNIADVPTIMWKGDTWSFTTGKYDVVEVFESYVTDPNLRAVWEDYYTGDDTSAEVGLESTIVRGGSKSMRYWYRNNLTPYYSESRADIVSLPSQIGSNWLADGVEALMLYFYGKADNDANEQMYVKLVDGDGAPQTATVTYDGDMNDIRKEEWQEWNISLSEFTDVNLANVSRVIIGFSHGGGAGGDGTVYFDDIRLYLSRCILSKRGLNFAKIDYAPLDTGGDCAIDYRELELMVGDWLAEDGGYIATKNPGTAGLVAYYPMDEGSGTTTDDASVNDHNGTFVEDVFWVSPGFTGASSIGMDGTALSRVQIGTWNPAEPNGQLSLALWIKWAGPYDTGGQPQGLICKREGWGSAVMMFLFECDTPDDPDMRGTFAFRSFTTGIWSPTGILTPLIGQWAHLASTFDGTTAILYLNGGEVASGAFTFSNMTDSRMCLGNNNDYEYWGPGVFNGVMDEAYIFNRALEPNEVAYLADAATDPCDGELYTPLSSVAELYDKEPKGDRVVNFRDFAVLADIWLDDDMFP